MFACQVAAADGGRSLHFGHRSYEPGERAIGRSAHIETWPGTGEPGEGPFVVYLVPGKGPLWYGHLPENAIRVGHLDIARAVGDATYEVKASFVVPHVSDGPYAVWVCARDCHLGFGDLVYGAVRVQRDSAASTIQPAADPPSSSSRGGTSWIAAVIVALAVVGLAALVLRRRM